MRITIKNGSFVRLLFAALVLAALLAVRPGVNDAGKVLPSVYAQISEAPEQQVSILITHDGHADRMAAQVRSLGGAFERQLRLIRLIQAKAPP